jgi:hypothetical protein
MKLILIVAWLALLIPHCVTAQARTEVFRGKDISRRSDAESFDTNLTSTMEPGSGTLNGIQVIRMTNEIRFLTI